MRVSTKEQTLDLQLGALKKAGCSKIYTEKVSGGATADRPELAKVLDNVRSGDVLVIWKLDRLGRSLKNLIEIVNELLQRKVGLEPQLTRHGYNAKVLSEVLNAKPREIRALLRGQLPPGRAQELQHEMLAVGIPI